LLLCDKVFRLHVDTVRIDKAFLAYALNSRIARAQIELVLSGGSGLANNIAQGVVKDLIVALPSPEEQRSIVEFLDRQTGRLDALIAKVRDAVERLDELRTSTIAAAVTGAIDLREVGA
jgi:type I restriction enzyme S subunit